MWSDYSICHFCYIQNNIIETNVVDLCPSCWSPCCEYHLTIWANVESTNAEGQVLIDHIHHRKVAN